MVLANLRSYCAKAQRVEPDLMQFWHVKLLRNKGVKIANIGHTEIVVFEKLVHVILDPEEGDIGSDEKGDEGIWRI